MDKELQELAVETARLIKAVKSKDTNTIVREMAQDIAFYPIKAAEAQRDLFCVIIENIISILERISRLEARVEEIQRKLVE